MAYFASTFVRNPHDQTDNFVQVDRNLEQAIKRDIYGQLQAGVPASEVAKMIGTKYADNANLAINIWRSDAAKVDKRSRDAGNQLISEYANLARDPNYVINTSDPYLSPDMLSHLDSRSSDIIKTNTAKRSGINKAVGALGKVAKFAVPAAIATIGTAGLGNVLSGAGAGLGAAETGVSAGNSLNSGGLVSSLSSSFAPKAAFKGALSGALTGGISDGVSGALKGGALGGVTGGYGDALGSSIGLGKEATTAFRKGLTASSGGLATGNLKDAGLAALLAGGGSYLSGKLPGLDSVFGSQPTSEELLKAPSGVQYSAPGTLSGGGNMSLSTLLKPASSLYSVYSARQTEDELKDALLVSQDKAKQALQPYLQSGTQANNILLSKLLSGELGGSYTPGDLTQNPGYQFQLEEGQKALDRTQAARGNLYSGAALKEASRYSQGLAEQTYNDDFNRWLSEQNNTFNQLSTTANQGYNAANSVSGVYDNIGNIKANSALTKNNIKSAALAQLLAGIDPEYMNYL